MVTPEPTNGQTAAALLRPITGIELREALIAASAHLREQAAAVDAINVYPVPDGDTGANMSATFAEAVAATMTTAGSVSAAEVLRLLARGSLFGARGNSGVILSQALRGFSQAVEGDVVDGETAARGLAGAAKSAYGAVASPKEGTMLTVLRAAGEAASAYLTRIAGGGRGSPCIGVLRVAVEAAEEAEAATIDQLPELREAGVTDAGGEGVCVILRGLVAALEGRAPVVNSIPASAPLHTASAEERYGFCTEFLLEPLEGGTLAIEAIRALAGAAPNRSLVLVGDESLARVHVHSEQPQALIEAMGSFGKLSRVKFEDMSAQNSRFRASGSGAGAKVALLAMSRGAGWDAIFEGLGAAVADLGVITKPAAGDIALAADSLNLADVIVLPNHKNVLLAAEQAKSLSRATLHIVPSRTLPQGIAAAIAFDSTASARDNMAPMTDALATVRTVEVTRSAAARTVNGVVLREGDAIALVDDDLVLAADDAYTALQGGLERAGASKASLVTVYSGGENTSDGLVERLKEAFPGPEVEVIAGGQPLYSFIASVED